MEFVSIEELVPRDHLSKHKSAHNRKPRLKKTGFISNLTRLEMTGFFLLPAFCKCGLFLELLPEDHAAADCFEE